MKLKRRRSLTLGTTIVCFVGFALAYQGKNSKILPKSSPELDVYSSSYTSPEINEDKVSENESAANQVRSYQSKITSLANTYIAGFTSLLESVRTEYTYQVKVSADSTNKSLEQLITNFYPTLELPDHLSEAEDFFLKGSDELTSIYNTAITTNKRTIENENAASKIHSYTTQLTSLWTKYNNSFSKITESVRNEYSPQLENKLKYWTGIFTSLITNFYPTLELPDHLSEAEEFFLKGSDELTSIYNAAMTVHNIAIDSKNKEENAKIKVDQYKQQITSIAQSYIAATSTYEEVVYSKYKPQFEVSRDSSNSKLQSLITNYYPTNLSLHLEDALQFFINGSDELSRIYYEAQIEQNKYNGSTDAAAKKEINSYSSQLTDLASKFLNALESFHEVIKTEYIPRIGEIRDHYLNNLQNLINDYDTSGELYSHLPEAREFFITGSDELTETYNAAVATNVAIDKIKVENENAKSKITSYIAKLASEYNSISSDIHLLMDIVQEVFLPQLTDIKNLYESKLQNLIDLYYDKEQLANHLETALHLYTEGADELARICNEAKSINESGGKSIVSVELTPVESGSTNISKIIAEEGDSIFIHASLNTNYKFQKWTINGDSVSSNSYMFMKVPTGYTTVIGSAERISEELVISDTEEYGWEQHSGQLTIKECTSGNLAKKIDEALQRYGIDSRDINKCIVLGSLNADDLWSLGILENCNTIDLKAVRTLNALPTSAFNLNKNLKDLLLPASIVNIGDFVFNQYSSLSNIYCFAEIPPTILPNSLQGVPYDLTVWVPRKSVELYKTTEGWSKYNIQPLEVKEYEGYLYMNLYLYSNRMMQILLSEIPIITFDDEEICIQTKSYNLKYPISDFKKVSYSNSRLETGIDEIITPESKYHIDDRTIYFHGLKNNSILNVFTIDGKLVENKKLKIVNERCEYNFHHLTSGIYIIRIDDITCKISIK